MISNKLQKTSVNWANSTGNGVFNRLQRQNFSQKRQAVFSVNVRIGRHGDVQNETSDIISILIIQLAILASKETTGFLNNGIYFPERLKNTFLKSDIQYSLYYFLC